MTFASWYRSTGADPPFGNLVRAHPGVAMEGYFWRITDVTSGRVLIALCGANQGPRGSWATVGLAAWPHGFLRTAAVDGAWTDAHGLGVRGGTRENTGHRRAFEADRHTLRVNLGEGAQLAAAFHDPFPWPHRALGGSSIFQVVPGLNQYWHPWLLHGKASGTAHIGHETWNFADADIYAEKNWGRAGFPKAWWWGQAHGFIEPTACVAFAGGIVTNGRFRLEVTALVVRLPDGRLVRLGNPVISPVRARVSDETWELSGRGYGWHIEVSATAPREQAFILPVPLPSEHRNVAGDLEQLAGQLKISVRRFGRHIWTGHTALAALELGGLERAAHEVRRRGLDPATTAAPPVATRF